MFIFFILLAQRKALTRNCRTGRSLDRMMEQMAMTTTGRGLDQCDAYWVSETVPLQCAAAGRNTGKDYVIFRKDVNTCMTPLIIRSTSFSSLSAAMPLTVSDRTGPGQGDGPLDIIIMIDGGFHAAIGHPCQILVRSI